MTTACYTVVYSSTSFSGVMSDPNVTGNEPRRKCTGLYRALIVPYCYIGYILTFMIHRFDNTMGYSQTVYMLQDCIVDIVLGKLFSTLYNQIRHWGTQIRILLYTVSHSDSSLVTKIFFG